MYDKDLDFIEINKKGGGDAVVFRILCSSLFKRVPRYFFGMIDEIHRYE